MPAEPVICRYTYTAREFKQLQWAAWLSNRKMLIFMAIPLFLLGMGVYQTYSDQTADLPPDAPDRPSLLFSFLTNEIPPVLFCIFLVYLFFFRPRTVFRKGLAYDREVVYCLSEEGIQCRTALMGIDAKWEAVSHLIESRDGFQFTFAGNVATYWLPKHGLEAADGIEQIRVLARKHVKKSRLLST